MQHWPSAIPKPLWKTCKHIAHCIKTEGGQALLVGGCVRDACWGYPIHDIDMEIFGMVPEALEAALKPHYPLKFTGKSFGVFKLKSHAIDLSIPRTEKPTGPKHQDFKVHHDPQMSLHQAALRRDFTINAIYANPLSEELIDPLLGLRELQGRQLRHCSDQFSEDPLRVLRAMRFIVRFELQPDSATLKLCETMSPAHLSPERIAEEWSRFLLEGGRLSRGLHFLQQCKWLQYYPQLERLSKDEKKWAATLSSLDNLGSAKLASHRFEKNFSSDNIPQSHQEKHPQSHQKNTPQSQPANTQKHLGLAQAVLLHQLSLKEARSFLEALSLGNLSKKLAENLLSAHLKFTQCTEQGEPKAQNTLKAILPDLSVELGGLSEFVTFLELCNSPEASQIKEQARSLGILEAPPAPLLCGEDALRLGLASGPLIGKLLKRCYALQLKGEIKNRFEAERSLKQLAASHLEEPLP